MGWVVSFHKGRARKVQFVEWRLHINFINLNDMWMLCCGALCHHDHLVLSVGEIYFDRDSRGWEGRDCPNNEKWSVADACLLFTVAGNRDIWGENGKRGLHVCDARMREWRVRCMRCEGICIFIPPSNCGNKHYMCFKVLQTSDNEAIICFIFKLIYHHQQGVYHAAWC